MVELRTRKTALSPVELRPSLFGSDSRKDRIRHARSASCSSVLRLLVSAEEKVRQANFVEPMVRGLIVGMKPSA